MSFQVRKLLRGDDVNKVTAFRVESSKTFNENETIVSFIDEFESNASDLNPTILAQINRLQRNLKGLPPLIEEVQQQDQASAPTSVAADPAEKQGKKIVFD